MEIIRQVVTALLCESPTMELTAQLRQRIVEGEGRTLLKGIIGFAKEHTRDCDTALLETMHLLECLAG